ncbi:MAG: archaellin/type IV pilin N-terminal domain-containing protein [Nitrososphaerales archaeon]
MNKSSSLFFFRHRNNGKRAISEIIATLLMIVIVVGLGATVFAFATSGFSSFGNSFYNLFQSSSNQIAEDVVIEQVAFTNTGMPSTSGITLYVMNAGVSPSTIEAVYVQNVTATVFVKQFIGSPLPVSINSGVVQSIVIAGFVPDHGTVYAITIATAFGNTVAYDARYN